MIQADHLRLTTDQIADHEIYHAIIRWESWLNGEIEEKIRLKVDGEKELDAIVAVYTEKLRGIVSLSENATPDEIEAAFKLIKEEIFADAYAGINAFGAHAEQFQDIVQTALEAHGFAPGGQTAAATDRTTGPPVRYSIDPNFEAEIDAWDGHSVKAFEVGTISDALKSIGVKDNRIIWHSTKIANILQKHSAMDIHIIKQVPQILENPVIILKSKNIDSRIVLFGEVQDLSGKPVTAVMELMPTNKTGRVLDLNIVASAYGKDQIKNFIRSSEVLYLDPNKKRTDTWLKSFGLQLPSGTATYGSIGNISYAGGQVNITGKKIFRNAHNRPSVQRHSIDEQTPEQKQESMENLRRYMDGETRTQDSGNAGEPVNLQTYAQSEAQKIVETAHEQGLSVDAYLRQNWELYEYDGQLSEAAQAALELEKDQEPAGRQYSVNRTQDGMENLRRYADDETRTENRDLLDAARNTGYNEDIDTAEGGVNDGRENGNGKNWRLHEALSGEQDSVGIRRSGTAEEAVYETGRAGRRTGETVQNRDSEGRRLTEEVAAQLEGSAIVDGSGHPMAVYHFTPEMEFETFERGDIGFHFGTEEQAEKRGKNLKAGSGRMFRVYLNIKNPVRVDADIMGWTSKGTALKLWSMGVLSDTELKQVNDLWETGDQYSSKSARKLREILNKKGYDGIVYPNGFEGRGDSYIALYDAQIVRTDVLPGDKQHSINRTRYSVEDTAGDPAQAYSYEALVAKPDMKLTVLTEQVPRTEDGKIDRKEVSDNAIRKIRALNNPNNTERQVFVYIPDIDADVLINRMGIRHGLARRSESAEATARVEMQLGDILQNAVKVNELAPRSADIESSHVLMGFATDREGNLYPVRALVNQMRNSVAEADVEILNTLYSAKAKKVGADSTHNLGLSENSLQFLADSAPTTISIADVLDIVKDAYPDTLPQSVLAHYGISRPETALGRSTRYSVDEMEREDREVAAEPRRTRRPAAESRPIIAKQELRQSLLGLFSIPEGMRAELGTVIDQYADRLLKNGTLTQEDRDAFLNRMYAAGVMTVPAEENFALGREALRSGKIYVSEEERRQFGDGWNDFRKRAFANGIYLTGNESDQSVDAWHRDLADVLPVLFDADETDNRTILERLVQVAEEGKAEKVSLPEYTAQLAQQDYVREDEVLDNMERQMDWALRTFAEKAQLEIRLRDRTGVKIAQEREKFGEAMRRQRQQDLVRRAKERDNRKAMQRQQQENRALREMQQKTLKQLQWLAKNRHRAPKDLKAVWDEVLGDIDIYAIGAANEMNWNGRYQATWKDLAKLYKAARESDPNFMPSAELQRIVTRLDGDKIADMDLEALNDLYKAAVGLRTEFYNRNNVLTDEMRRIFSEIYTDAKTEIETAPGGFSGRGLDRFMNLEQLTPMNVLERMGGWNPQGAFYSMARQLEKGERDIRAYHVRASQYLEDFLTEHESWVKKADGQGKDGIWYEIEVPELLELGLGDKPIFGDTVKVYMTPSQKVHLYLESKNTDNLRHMTGGRTFADRELYSQGKRQEAFAQGKTIRLAPETVKRIVSDMTEEELELARRLEDYYNNYAKAVINRIANILYGYDKARSKNYAPIFTNKNYVQSELGIYDMTAEGVGHLKARQYSVNPSYNIGAFDAFERHVEQTARFVGMSIPVRNWQSLLNWREKNNSMGDVITHKWGEESKRYIEELLNRLQGGTAVERTAVGDFADQLFSNYISAVFGANPSIVLKQLGSIPLASAYLGTQTFPSPVQIAQIDRDLIGKYTSDLAWRTMGYSTPETKHLKENPNWAQTNKTTRFAFGGGSITAMDGWAASVLWPWAENTVRREFPDLELGTQEQIDAGRSPFYQKVAELFNEAVSRSQSVSDELHQSKLRKSRNPVTRAFTMFKSDSAQAYNTLRQKIGEARFYARSGDTENARRARKAVGSSFVSLIGGNLWAAVVSFLVAMWKNKGKYYRDDEDELTAESVAREMVMDLAGSMAGVVAGGEELMEIIGNVLTGDTWYGIDTPGLGQLTDVIELLQQEAGKGLNVIRDAVDVVKNGGNLAAYFKRHGSDILGSIKELAEAAATYVKGIPVQNLEAYILGAVRWIAPELATAYDDLLAAAEKADLDGLDGKALEQRIDSILSARLGDIPEDAAEELAKLYEAGFAQAIPGNTPSKMTVNGEERSLGAYQQQIYDTVWRDSVAETFAQLLDQEWYTDLDDQGRAKVLAKLYDYGVQSAKATLFDDYVPDSFVQKISAYRSAGLDAVDYLEAWEKYAELEGTEDRAAAFSYWADRQGYTEKQLQTVMDSFSVHSQRYEDLKAAGLDSGDAYALTGDLDALEPLDGARSVSDTQKLQAIADAGLEGEALLAAAGTVLGTEMTTESGNPSQYAKLVQILDSGLDMDGYLSLREMDGVDEYLDALDAGLDSDAALDMARALGDLEPEQGEDSVSVLQKQRAVIDAGLTVQEQLAALESISSESEYKKFRTAHTFGVEPDAYVCAKEILPQFDKPNANGNYGTYTQAEIEEALDALGTGTNGILLPMAGQMSVTLTNDQKAVLWQLLTGSSSAKNNPYSTSIGWDVLDAYKAS